MSDRAAKVKFMFDTSVSSPAADSAVPLERLEAQICELAGHLAAATRRFLAGAVLLKALRAAAGDLAHPHEEHDGVSAETREPRKATSSNLADALVAVAEAFLAEQVAGAQDAEIYQVVVHVGTEATGGPPAPPCHNPEGA
jgi:hypothetical protein